MPVCHEQLLKVLDLLLEFMAAVGVAHEHAMILELFELHAAMNVGAFAYCLFLGLERLVFD